MPQKDFPARVHIILARESSLAVAIRRGPSSSVCTVLWDRKNDTFKLGQWMRGRIYERRCDLSPDGRHFVYFACNGKWDSEVKGSWTAISSTPYLKALGLWANGSCWGGGGLFTSNFSFWINDFMYKQEGQLAPQYLKRDERVPFQGNYGGECPGLYYHRLPRYGWRLARHGGSRGDGYTLFQKDLPGGWMLEKTAHATMSSPGRGCYYDTHALYHMERGLAIDHPEWEWADLDGERLVWIEKGVLFAARLTTKGPGFARRLYDFNPMKFEAIPAPY